MRGQLFAPLLRDLGQTGVQPLQVLKLVQQLGGAFGSNARHARHLRAADPRQPPVIRQLLRGDAELAGDEGGVQPALLKVVADADGGRQQLAVAFVGGDDGGLMARTGPPLPPGWRRDRPLRCPARPSSGSPAVRRRPAAPASRPPASPASARGRLCTPAGAGGASRGRDPHHRTPPPRGWADCGRSAAPGHAGRYRRRVNPAPRGCGGSDLTRRRLTDEQPQIPPYSQRL